MFLQRRLFQPLGMADTGAGNRAPRPEQQAVGYAAKEPLPSFELETVGIGAGDLWSTTHDLARWDAALVKPSLLLSEASLQAMFTPHAAIPDSFVEIAGTSYGYGWCITRVEGHQTRLHPGDNSGFCSLNIHLPDQDTIVILLSNNADSDLSAISRRLVSKLLGDQRRGR